MIEITNWIFDVTGLSLQLQTKIGGSLLTILLLWLIRTVIVRTVWRRTESVHFRYRWQKISAYIAVTLGILLVGRIWFAGIQSLATYLGLATAGLAIALQDIVKALPDGVLYYGVVRFHWATAYRSVNIQGM